MLSPEGQLGSVARTGLPAGKPLELPLEQTLKKVFDNILGELEAIKRVKQFLGHRVQERTKGRSRCRQRDYTVGCHFVAVGLSVRVDRPQRLRP